MHLSSSQLGGQFSLLDLCLLPQIKVAAASPVSGLFICLFICQEQKSTHTIALEIRALCHGHGRNSRDAGLPHSQLQGGVAQISCCTPDFVTDAQSVEAWPGLYKGTETDQGMFQNKRVGHQAKLMKSTWKVGLSWEPESHRIREVSHPLSLWVLSAHWLLF